MNKSDVKEKLKNRVCGKIVDIDIYFNQYTNMYQATVIVISKSHIVWQYICDESDFISCSIMNVRV